MPDASKPPIVIYSSCDASGHGRLHVGYLRRRGGAHWCFPDEEMIPDQGFKVDDAALKPLAGLTADRAVYLFQPAAHRLQGYAKT